MRANTISVKPLSEIHFYTAILAFSVFFFLDIAAILTLDKLAIILAIASNLFVVICYMLVRLFYNVRYTVNHECLLKTKGTEVLFGIDVRDIVAVYIKPRSKIDFLSYLWDVIINSGFPQEPHGTTF